MKVKTLIKESTLLGLELQFRGLVHCQDGRKHGNMQGDMVLEKGLRAVHLDSQAAGRERHTGRGWNI